MFAFLGHSGSAEDSSEVDRSKQAPRIDDECESWMHPPILIASRSEADALSQRPELSISAIIAITDSEERACLGFDRMSHKLLLKFEDRIEGESNRPYFASRVPSAEDVAVIEAFARSIAVMRGGLLCHCTAGRSRSPAVALIVLATWLGEGQEVAAVNEILRIRPTATPHRGLVRLADEAMGRCGKLIGALDDALANRASQ